METVKTVDINNNEIELNVNDLSVKDLQDAQFQYNIKIAELMRKGVSSGQKLISRSQLDSYLKELGIWSDIDQKLFIETQVALFEMGEKLKLPNIKISEGKELSLSMREKRNLLMSLYAKRSQFDEITMESMAEQHRFKFIIVRSIYDKTGKLFFKDIEDYTNRQDEQAAVDCAKSLACKLFGYKNDFIECLPENVWMSKYGFTKNDEDFIDADGNIISLSQSSNTEEATHISDNIKQVKSKKKKNR